MRLEGRGRAAPAALSCSPAHLMVAPLFGLKSHIVVAPLPVCLRMAPPLRYLITAPRSLRLDAVETVLLQLFGFTAEVRVYVFLKTSMAPDHVLLAQEAVTLNAQNHHQAVAQVRVRHHAAASSPPPPPPPSTRSVLCPPAVPGPAAAHRQSCDPACPISRDQPAPVRPRQPHQRLPVHPDGQTAVHAAAGR